MERVNWDQCPAYAEHTTLDGHELVVICTLPTHCDPQDATAEHEDERFGIRWRYSEE